MAFETFNSIPNRDDDNESSCKQLSYIAEIDLKTLQVSYKAEGELHVAGAS